MKLCMTVRFSERNIFSTKNGGNEPKLGFLNLVKVWSIMKVYIICYIFAQIPYLGKIYFLRHGPKYSLPTDCVIFKQAISLEQNDEMSDFFAFQYKFMEIKS